MPVQNTGLLRRGAFVDWKIISTSKSAMGTFTGSSSAEKPDFSRSVDDVSVVGGVGNIAFGCWEREAYTMFLWKLKGTRRSSL